MVLNAYIDDSGSHSDSATFVLAGYVATTNNWANFSAEFDILRQKAPGFEYLRAAEAMHMRGQFAESRGWSRSHRDKRIEEFAYLISKHVSLQISIELNRNDFENTIKNLPVMNGDRTQANDHPYLFLWYRMMAEYLLHGAEHGLCEPCSFIFDEQLGYTERAHQLWLGMKDLIQRSRLQSAKEMLGPPPAFMDDKTVPPLQAADLYAWSLRRLIVVNDIEDKLSQSTIDKLATIPSMHITVTREHLISIYNKMMSVAHSVARSNPEARWTFPRDS